MTQIDPGEHDQTIIPDDETSRSSHNANEKASITKFSRVLRPRPKKLSSTMAINTGSPAIIETNATTNASETLNSEKPSKRRKRKAIKTKDEVVVDQGIGSKAVQNASPGVPVTQSCTTPGTLHTRSGRLPKSGQYPMVFEPDMMLSVHRKSWSLRYTLSSRTHS